MITVVLGHSSLSQMISLEIGRATFPTAQMLQMRDEFRSQIKILRAQYEKAAARAANAVVVAKTTSEALEVAQREAFEAFGSLRATLRERDHSKAECMNLRKQNKEVSNDTRLR
jgi:hypothetical protein